MKPRLLFSELSNNVYVATRYTAKAHPTLPGREIILAHTKYDVTEDFDALIGVRRRYLARMKRKKAAEQKTKTEQEAKTGETT